MESAVAPCSTPRARNMSVIDCAALGGPGTCRQVSHPGPFSTQCVGAMGAECNADTYADHCEGDILTYCDNTLRTIDCSLQWPGRRCLTNMYGKPGCG